MLHHESETVEFKSIVVDDIKKEIIAFANCDGGKLYIGVNNDGSIAGLDDPDQAALQISNMARDTIKPDITMFLHYEILTEDGKQFVAIDIQRGTDRPYYIAKKGMRPEGVYVRQGFSSVPATDTAIRRMIKETDGDRFEMMRSINQELTFCSAQREFQLRNVTFESQQMRSLKLIDRDGLYTNLAQLLADQCPHSTKVAVFQGTDQTIFKDRREFTGSILQQMNEVYEYIDFRNQTRATIEGLLRIDTRDYPEIAVREALLNMLVHRDYSFRSSALISIYDDRIELVSIGGLPSGVELEDIMLGISVCRNEHLADVFYRLQLIEAYGTGIGKILKSYEGTSQTPRIETTKNAFKITLPNVNAPANIVSTSLLRESPSCYYAPRIQGDDQQSREKALLSYFEQHQSISRPEAEKLLDVSSSTATRLLRKMVQNGQLQSHGRARDTRYTLCNQQNG